jgi:ubiquinone/menaquinone biosynthesis C-methylase UbiE
MTELSLALDTPDLAAHYERNSVDRQFKAGKRLIERIGIRPGQSVLDVGSGTGLLAAYVAELVGDDGRVHGVDPLPLRIEIAQTKAKAKTNLEFSVDNAFDLKAFQPASFDVVYLNAVFHWFPEKLEPLRNFHRLLKAGGKLALSTGSKDHPNRIHDIQRTVLARAPYNAHSRPEQGLPHRVSPDELRGLLDQAGFDIVSLDVEPNSNLHKDAEAAVKHSLASSFGNLLGHLPEELRESARRDVIAELQQYQTAEGIKQDGARILAVAVKR